MDMYNEDQTIQKDLEVLWTVGQAARYLSLSPGTIYNWIGKKKMLDPEKLIRISNRVRIPRSEVIRIASNIKSKLKD